MDMDKSVELFKKYVKSMGLSVFGHTHSGLSSSQYVFVESPDGGENKIRFSDHVLPPSYSYTQGDADFEVGLHDESTGGWPNAVAWVAKKHNLQVPAAVQSLLSKQALAKAAKVAEYEKWEAYHRDRLLEQKQQTQALIEKVRQVRPELIAEWEQSSGKQRKKLKEKIVKAGSRL